MPLNNYKQSLLFLYKVVYIYIYCLYNYTHGGTGVITKKCLSTHKILIINVHCTTGPAWFTIPKTVHTAQPLNGHSPITGDLGLWMQHWNEMKN